LVQLHKIWDGWESCGKICPILFPSRMVQLGEGLRPIVLCVGSVWRTADLINLNSIYLESEKPVAYPGIIHTRYQLSIQFIWLYIYLYTIPKAIGLYLYLYIYLYNVYVMENLCWRDELDYGNIFKVEGDNLRYYLLL